MNTLTLTLTEIAPYLPNKLNCQYKNGKIVTITGYEGNCLRFEDETGCSYAPVEYFKPILYPLSHLTKPMDDGRVPLIECAKLIDSVGEWTVIESRCAVSNNENWCELRYSGGQFDLLNWANEQIGYNQWPIFQKLAKMHIDFQGLIERGLAIDATTLNVNPYL